MSEWTEQSRLVAANFHELEAKFYSTGARIAASFVARESAFEYARESRRHSDFAAMHRVESVRLRPNPNWVSVGPSVGYELFSVDYAKDSFAGEWPKPCGCTDATFCFSCAPHRFNSDGELKPVDSDSFVVEIKP